MNREIIIEELQKRGFSAEAYDVIKNGTVNRGITFIDENLKICPVINTDNIIQSAENEEKTLSEVVDIILNAYYSNKEIDINSDDFSNRNEILNNIYIAIQRESCERIVKRKIKELKKIEMYLLFRKKNSEGNFYTARITEEILLGAGISKDEAWETAERNTFAETKLIAMMELIFGITESKSNHKSDDFPTLYVLTNNCQIHGASAILNKDVISEFAKKHNTNKIIALPSSIHEFLIIPWDNETKICIDNYSDIVRSVNNQVDLRDRLGDCAYILNV